MTGGSGAVRCADRPSDVTTLNSRVLQAQTAAFKLRRFPQAERASGYLAGMCFQSGGIQAPAFYSRRVCFVDSGNPHEADGCCEMKNDKRQTERRYSAAAQIGRALLFRVHFST